MVVYNIVLKCVVWRGGGGGRDLPAVSIVWGPQRRTGDNKEDGAENTKAGRSPADLPTKIGSPRAKGRP